MKFLLSHCPLEHKKETGKIMRICEELKVELHTFLTSALDGD
jgi:hypothetical protein